MDQRAEGVYCKLEEYPPGLGKLNIFTVERVNGDQTVSSFSCTVGEAVVIQEFLNRRD